MEHWKKKLTLLFIATFIGSYIGATKAMAETYFYHKQISGYVQSEKTYPFCLEDHCIFSENTEFSFIFNSKDMIIEDGDDIENSIIIVNDVATDPILWQAQSSNENILKSEDISIDDNGIFVDSNNINITSEEEFTISGYAYMNGELVDLEKFTITTSLGQYPFITTWDITAGETVTIPTYKNSSSYKYNGTIDWGDGTTAKFFYATDPNLTHTYISGGTYTVSIRGTFEALPYPSYDSDIEGVVSQIPTQLKTVEQLGNVGWRYLSGAFGNAFNIEKIKGGFCDLSKVYDVYALFSMDYDWWGIDSNPALTEVDFSDCNLVGDADYLESLFYRNPNLTTINLSGLLFDDKEYYPYDAFYGASSLSSITYNKSVTTERYNNFLQFINYQYAGLRSIPEGEEGNIYAGPNSCDGNIECKSARIALEAKGWTINDGTTETEITISDAALETYWTVTTGETITFPAYQYARAKNGIVDWGDGTTETFSSLYGLSHTYETADTYKILIDGEIVTDMYRLFESQTLPENMDISNWDLSNAKDLGRMFYKTVLNSSFDISILNNMSNVTNLNYTFGYTTGSGNTLDLSNLSMPNLTNSSYMFAYNSELTNINLSNWDTPNLINMYSMFYNAGSPVDVDLSGWDTSSISNINTMFYNASTIKYLDISGWDFSNFTSYSNSFSGATGLLRIDYLTTMSSDQYAAFIKVLSAGTTNLKVTSVAVIEAGDNACADTDEECLLNREYIKSKGWKINDATTASPTLQISDQHLVTYWDLDAPGSITLPFSTSATAKQGTIDWGDGTVELYYSLSSLSHTYSTAGRKTILIDGDITTNMNNLFRGKVIPSNMDISEWDVSHVTTAQYLFQGSTRTELNIQNWNFQNCTNFYYIIDYARSLTDANLRGWNTSKVSNMFKLLNGCNKLRNLDLSGWDFSKVTSTSYAWNELGNLKTFKYDIPVSLDQYTAFFSMLNEPGVEAFPNSTNSGIIEAGSNSCDGSSTCIINRQKIIDKGWTINDATTESVTGENGLQTYWTVSAGETVTMPFATNSSADNGTIDWGDGTVESFSDSSTLTHTYATAGTKEILIDGDILYDMRYLFYNKTIPAELDISNWDTSTVEDMYMMFRGATLPSNLNINNWDTGSVTDFSYMFYYSKGEATVDIANWDVSSAINLRYMFYSSETSPASLDLSSWDVSNATAIYSSFRNIDNLGDINLSGWNLSGTTNLSYLFYESNNAGDINLTGWEISHVTSVSGMFNIGDVSGNIIYSETTSPENYSAILKALAQGLLPDTTSGKIIKGSNLCPVDDGNVCAGYTRDLIQKGWTFVDTE